MKLAINILGTFESKRHVRFLIFLDVGASSAVVVFLAKLEEKVGGIVVCVRCNRGV